MPNLGVVDAGGGDYVTRAFVMADVPGLIEGASEGRGLGLQFLKHLERTSLIAYVIDALDPEREPIEALKILKTELSRFSPELAGKRFVVILNKIDLVDDEALAKVRAPIEALGHEVLTISAATGRQIAELKFRLFALVQEEKARLADEIVLIGTADPGFAYTGSPVETGDRAPH